MERATVFALALVTAVGLAGCAGLLGTQTPTPETSSAQTGPYNGSVDGRTVLERHDQSLAAAETFSYEQNTTVRLNGDGRLVQVTNVSAAVNRSGTYSAQTRTLDGIASVYVGREGNAYQRQQSGNRVVYGRPLQSERDAGFYATPPIDRYLDGLNYSYRGTATADSQTVSVYAASGVERLTPSEHGLSVIDPGNVTSVESELRVTADGRIHSFEYRATGTNYYGEDLRYTLRIEYSGVGSTTVTEPPWVEQARARQ